MSEVISNEGPNRHARRAMVAIARSAAFIEKKRRMQEAFDENKKKHREAIAKRHAENREKSLARKLAKKNANK